MNTIKEYNSFIKQSSIEVGFKYPTLEELNELKIKIITTKSGTKTRLMWDTEFIDKIYLSDIKEIYSIQSINNNERIKDNYGKVSSNSITYK